MHKVCDIGFTSISMYRFKKENLTFAFIKLEDKLQKIGAQFLFTETKIIWHTEILKIKHFQDSLHFYMPFRIIIFANTKQGNKNLNNIKIQTDVCFWQKASSIKSTSGKTGIA